jgi:curved DNA-binding protein CbpA
MKDWYTILGVLPSVEPETLRPIYLALLKKYHPDVFRGNPNFAETKTKDINEAYRILSDPELRQKFDESFSSHQRSRSETPSSTENSASIINLGSANNSQNTIVFSEESISALLDLFSSKEIGFFILGFGQNLFIQHGTMDGWLAHVDVGNSGNPFEDTQKENLIAAGFTLDDDFIIYSKKFSILPYDKEGSMKAIFEAAECLGVSNGTIAKLDIDEMEFASPVIDEGTNKKDKKRVFGTFFWVILIVLGLVFGNVIPENFWTLKGVFSQNQ